MVFCQRKEPVKTTVLSGLVKGKKKLPDNKYKMSY